MASNTAENAQGAESEPGTSIGMRGRTMIELEQRADGTWEASQPDLAVIGTGETGALAAMDYCRQIAKGAHESER